MHPFFCLLGPKQPDGSGYVDLTRHLQNALRTSKGAGVKIDMNALREKQKQEDKKVGNPQI